MCVVNVRMLIYSQSQAPRELKARILQIVCVGISVANGDSRRHKILQNDLSPYGLIQREEGEREIG